MLPGNATGRAPRLPARGRQAASHTLARPTGRIGGTVAAWARGLLSRKPQQRREKRESGSPQRTRQAGNRIRVDTFHGPEKFC